MSGTEHARGAVRLTVTRSRCKGGGGLVVEDICPSSATSCGT